MTYTKYLVSHGRPSGGDRTGCGLTVEELLEAHDTIAESVDQINCSECLRLYGEWRGLVGLSAGLPDYTDAEVEDHRGQEARLLAEYYGVC